MKTDSYYLFIKKYAEEHSDDFVASHETNNTSVPERILQTGLRVSHSPYGRKINFFKKEDGSIDLDKAFIATMYILDASSIENSKFYLETPTAPVVINIPKELLETVDAKTNADETPQFFAIYGHEEYPVENEGKCGKITPLETSKGANIRLLPTCFIAGYFDPVKEVFVENDKHFSKLSKEEQVRILNQYTLKFEQTQNQPQ